MNRTFACLILTVGACSTAAAAAEPKSLIIHEWGTFTSFQDERGLTISGINVDDEPVPEFVHRLKDIPILTTRSAPASWSKGAPRCHPDVTLRLETPVLYFYPQPGFAADQSIDVRATLSGGWLTEFFPQADAEYSGFPRALERSTRSSLLWAKLRLTSQPAIALPETAEHVWLAPRKVRSAVVLNGAKQEAEKYLFYRGVGHMDAPIVVRQQDDTLTVSVRDDEKHLPSLPPAWIVHRLVDGRIAYRSVAASQQRSVAVSLPVAGEAVPSRLDALKREIKAALLAQGLYEDEADAMLATWQLSYFESDGLRVFFVLPRAWTEAHLPLWTSVPADTTRVMLGRVELVSPQQHAALRSLYELPASEIDFTPLYHEDQSVLKHVHDGTASHADLYRKVGREVPAALKLYESLGRFRDALLAHEARSTSDAAKRARLELIIQKFSACDPNLAGVPVTVQPARRAGATPPASTAPW